MEITYNNNNIYYGHITSRHQVIGFSQDDVCQSCCCRLKIRLEILLLLFIIISHADRIKGRSYATVLRPSVVVVVVCNVMYYHMAMAMAIWLYGIWLALWLNGASCSKSYTIDSLQEVIY